MSVRKPLEKKIDVDALIEKGAKVKADQQEKAWTNINIRIPVSMLKNVDAAVGRRIGITRTGWVLEALQDKLEGKYER